MDLTGKVITVLGAIQPGDLGVTMTHEHLSMKYDTAFRQPSPGDDHLVDKGFSLDTITWINNHPYSCKANLTMYGAEDAIEREMNEFKKCGGSTIVENSIHGLQRDMKFLVHLANSTGVNMIAGTGFYFNDFQPESIKNATVESLAAQIRTDIVDGWQGSSARCGVIGEVGCSYPLTEFEKRSLQASAIVQKELGAPLIIHPGRNDKSPEEILRYLSEEGADISKTIMSHMDRTITSDEGLLNLAKMGAILEYDFFGAESSYFQNNHDVSLPNDGERLRRIKLLIDEGYLDKIAMCHDIHTKHRLTEYGGHGYSHILKYVIPRMLGLGFTREQIDEILIHTPKKWLTFK